MTKLLKMYIYLDKALDIVLKYDLNDKSRWVLKTDQKLVRLSL